MIKNWHKWFVCIFAVIFVSVFFVFDAMFVNAGKNVYVPPPIIADDEPDVTPSEPEDKPTPTPDDKDDDQQDQEINLPSYVNGFTCFNDALERTLKLKYYVWDYASSAVSMGVLQTVKGKKYFNGEKFASEVYAYCESSLGQRWYERITSENGQSYKYVKTENINSNLQYDLNGASEEIMRREKIENDWFDRISMFTITPRKGVDKQAKFDRDTDKKYYIASFVINIGKIPERQINSIKKSSGASSVEYQNLIVTYYISKTTGLIEKLEQEEKYKMQIGISLTVDFKYAGRLKAYNNPYTINF